MAARSKKLLKVIDGIRSWNMSTSQISPSKVCVGIDESLKCENFQVGKIAVHGFPHQPTCMAFDPIQKIVAIGTKMGVIRIFGRPGVDYVVSHPSSSAVIEIMFLINEVRPCFYVACKLRIVNFSRFISTTTWFSLMPRYFGWY
ncbi:Syntaxin-binding protein 5 [Fasciola hepatica]|uniref:Syntaxin-binding protein 5 n=1 Tax=Fasciola hepatica TaxID=6192 RepID=A0A2H1CNK9_FASHE|nr:Syntaxin-binding protein 5 [Fasciola hepatica]